MKKEKGFILVIALMMLLVITMLGMAIITSSTLELKMAGNKRSSTNSFYSTDGAAQLVISNSDNFIASKFIGNRYNPYSDSANQNPTNSTSSITYFPDRVACPRGLGYSSTNFEFEYFTVTATGKDQVENQSTSNVEEDISRLVPVAQGGN